MSSTLIQLADGTYVEVEVQTDRVRQVSGSAAERVSSSLDDIRPLVLKVCDPLRSLWAELSRDMRPESMELELGLSFEAEGNVFVAKVSSTANITLTIIFSPNASRCNEE